MNKSILIVTSEFPPMPGGIGNHAFCLANELSKLNFSVTVLTESREQKAGEWQELLNANSDIQIIGIKRSRIIFLTYFLRILHLFRLIHRNKYQTIIYSGKFSVWLNGIMPKRKSIVVIHGSEIKQKGFSRFFFNRGLKRANFIVCVSNFTKEQLKLNYQELDFDKILVINNGFKINQNLNNLESKVIENKQLKLITVGGIHRRKGQFNVVRALPSIINSFPKTQYEIVGLPLEKDDLVDLIRNEKVENYVNFHHGLSDTQVIDILKSSHIFMMLSEYLKNGDFEGFGIAILEAMALGLPAIGSKDSGIADAIKDGYSGRLVDSKDINEVVKALLEIIRDYDEYSTNAKNWATGFQWENKVIEYQNLINKL